ncbi:MAG TPA: endolytic transglycosylase MltG [Terriglobales bacterium]|nr:endolytic transglycosylase MltG [Terriglobales bacterium]
MLRALTTLILIAVLLTAGWLAYSLCQPIGPAVEKFVLVRPGSSARRIAADLQNAGLIRSSSAFLALHYYQGRPALKAGEYRFDHAADAFEVHDRLARGDIVIRAVIIPEGYNIFEVATAIEAAGLGTQKQFLDLARSDLSLVSDLDPTARSLEGYLFPDTYHFTRTQSLHDVAAVMVRRFRQEARSLGLDSNFHGVVTLASIVEKETAAPEERPVVAGVFQNRMDRDMLLATDPSVVYAALLAGRYRGVIHQSDLDFDSPYNTYRYPGLPPGPIANPGRSSLQAAMHPAHTDYYFFVSDNQGRHRFAATAQEHSRNVARYRLDQARSH